MEGDDPPTLHLQASKQDEPTWESPLIPEFEDMNDPSMIPVESDMAQFAVSKFEGKRFVLAHTEVHSGGSSSMSQRSWYN